MASRPGHLRFLLALAAVAALGAAAWLAFGRGGGAPENGPTDGNGGETGLHVGEGPAPSDPGAPGPVVDPFVPPSGPVTPREAREGLRSRLDAVRQQALDAILRRGLVPDPESMRLIEEAARGPEGRLSATAKAVLMRVRGSREHLRHLAERAATSPQKDFYDDLVLLVDPAGGKALLVAAQVARERGEKGEALAGLPEALAALARDAREGGDAVASALASADEKDRGVWLEIAGGIKPVPPAVLSSVADRIRRGQGRARDEAMAYALRRDLDLSAAPDDLRLALTGRLSDPTDPLRGASMRAASRLPTVDDATLDHLVRAAAEGGQAANDALLALRNLGEKARAAVPRLLELEPRLTATHRFLLADALLGIGGPGFGEYAARRIGSAPDSERRLWLQRADALARLPDGAPAVSAVIGLATSGDPTRVEEALAALPKVDASAAREGAVQAAAAGLRDERPAVRLAAVRAIEALKALPAALAPPLVSAMGDADAKVREAAVAALAAAWRWGESGKPLVPAALGLLEDAQGPAAKAEVRVGLLRTIALDPEDARVRATLRAAVGSSVPDARLAGLHGLSKVAAPSPEERQAVLAARDDPLPRVRALAASVLALPAWK